MNSPSLREDREKEKKRGNEKPTLYPNSCSKIQITSAAHKANPSTIPEGRAEPKGRTK